jgi:hypothetical protein
MEARHTAKAAFDLTFFNQRFDLIDCSKTGVPDSTRASMAVRRVECGQVCVEHGGEVGTGTTSVHPTNLPTVEQGNPETLLFEQPRGSDAGDSRSNDGHVDFDIVRQRLEARQLDFVPDRFLLNC